MKDALTSDTIMRATDIDAPTLLSLDEAAHRLRVCKRTVVTLINNQELGSIKIRTRRLIPVAEIERFERVGTDAQGIESLS